MLSFIEPAQNCFIKRDDLLLLANLKIKTRCCTPRTVGTYLPYIRPMFMSFYVLYFFFRKIIHQPCKF